MNPELCLLLFVFWDPWGQVCREMQQERSNMSPENVSAGRVGIQGCGSPLISDRSNAPRRKELASWAGGFGQRAPG